MFRLESRARLYLVICTGCLVIIALWIWGTEGATKDELIVRGIGIGLIALLFPIVYFFKFIETPKDFSNHDKARVNELEKSIESQLQIIWEKGNHMRIAGISFVML